ncbi:sialic acid-binding Ig-like lectin 12 isoform X2 [Ambystoma mexicanum]|uniref:sialic acid-binding Ig-like lectin 12 isoform X2 n=1 Tax=Ambystoma mexicanum TaxID=8296 RepID=UPI0037E82B88
MGPAGLAEVPVLLLHLLGLLGGSQGIVYTVWEARGSPGKSITTAARILGRRGQSAVLPCSYMYSGADHTGNIHVFWKKSEDRSPKPETIFECTVHEEDAQGEPSLGFCRNATKQYRLVGNPRRNDLSLEIRNVTSNGTYLCGVQLSSLGDTKWQTEYGTELLVFGSSDVHLRVWTVEGKLGWSMTTAEEITGWEGQSAVLPCTFTYPKGDYRGDVKTIWKTPTEATAIDGGFFQCTVHNSSKGEQDWDECISGNERYRLAGDPRQNDLSLEIKNLSFTQKGKYSCRVELTERSGAMWETKYDTELLVHAPAEILNLAIEGNDTAVVCTAKGNPTPNITWMSPTLSQETYPLEDTPENFVLRSVINVTAQGTYTCVSVNMYARQERSILVRKGPEASRQFNVLTVLIPVLSVLILGLLAILVLVFWKRKGGLQKSSSGRKPSDTRTFPKQEIQEPEPPAAENQDGYTYSNIAFTKNPKQAENQDGCTYADIVFTKEPKQGNQKESTPAVHKEEEVTYAVVQNNMQVRPL